MLEKFTNCIYVLEHESAFLIDGVQTNKIESSKVLPGRIFLYNSAYPISVNVSGYFYIKDYDCYQLEDDIRKDFSQFVIKSYGGCDYFANINLEMLEKYLISKGIKYKLYQDQDFLQIDSKDKYEIITKGFKEQAETEAFKRANKCK